MITPYSKGINRTDALTLTADFKVITGRPTIIRCNKGENQLETINTEYIRRFLTHNPYDQSCIRNWEQLHNGGYNITVGVFGSIYDSDKNEKISQMEELRERLDDGCFKEDYSTCGENYYYALSSNRLVKTKRFSR